MPSNAIALAVAGFIAWYIISSIHSWYRLRQIPGPKLASFSYLWVAAKVLRGRGHEYEHLHKQYGPVVRVGPNYVLLDGPNDIRRLNGARDTPRDDWYIGAKLDPDRDTIVTMLQAGPHDAAKARLSFAYSGRDGINFEAGVDKQILHFVDVLRRRFLSKAGEDLRPLDFAHFVRYFTLDVITLIGFGKSFGFMDAEGDLYGFTSEVESLLGLIATAGDVPLLRRIFVSPFISRFLTPKPTATTGIGKVLGQVTCFSPKDYSHVLTTMFSVAHKIVEYRMEKDDEEVPDMITSFKRHGLDIDEVKGETMVQITAGSDTTAVVIRSTLMHLIASPRVYNRLKAEIREAIASGVSHPISVEQSKKLPYLQAVLWEGIRIRPPAVYGLYKNLPPKGDTFSGTFVPGGTAVGINNPSMMRLTSVFGPDSQLFRPERFLECSEAKRTEMIRTVDLVFGYGRWMCAGKQLAMVELNKIMFELLRAFDWQLVYPGKGWTEHTYTLSMQKDMWVSITEAENP